MDDGIRIEYVLKHFYNIKHRGEETIDLVHNFFEFVK